MTEHKYTDEEVIKALECCDGTFAGCEQCPMRKYRHHCNIKQQALALINRQKAEIERLNAEKDTLIKTYKECMVEAIKEFAEKLKKELTTGAAVMRVSTLDIIDDLVKEFTEE